MQLDLIPPPVSTSLIASEGKRYSRWNPAPKHIGRKWCSAHNKVHLVSEFGKGSRFKDGLDSFCKKYYREYRLRNRERRRSQGRLWRARNQEKLATRRKLVQEFVNKAKDKPCLDCGVKYPSYVMTFDHRDPTQKEFQIGGNQSRSIENFTREIAKCDVVCANCHAERTHKQRTARPAEKAAVNLRMGVR